MNSKMEYVPWMWLTSSIPNTNEFQYMRYFSDTNFRTCVLNPISKQGGGETHPPNISTSILKTKPANQTKKNTNPVQ